MNLLFDLLNMGNQGLFPEFIWVVVPGGVICGKITTATERAEAQFSHPLLKPQYEQIKKSVTNPEVVLGEKAPQVTDAVGSFILVDASILAGDTVIESLPWVEIKVDSISAWGIGKVNL